jgi:tetraacyldisaccharide 4'-kinase
MLGRAGQRVAFLSRGYGGEARSESLRVDPFQHSARRVGDEPLLLSRAGPCWVGPDRVASARLAVEAGANVLVMDDGLQNPSLFKDLTIAVVDGDSPFGNGLCLPAGPLRAPIAAQLAHVDAILLVGGDARMAARVALTAREKPLFRARLQADAIVAAALIGRPVLAMAGIGRPEKFFATLAGVGAQIVETAVFADHHAYRAREIEAVVRRAARRGLTLVTTEKDLVRLPPQLAGEVQAVPVTMSFDEPAAMKSWLKPLVG